MTNYNSCEKAFSTKVCQSSREYLYIYMKAEGRERGMGKEGKRARESTSTKLPLILKILYEIVLFYKPNFNIITFFFSRKG